MANGHRLRAEEIEQAGGILGRPVRVVVEDDRGDPAVANACMSASLHTGGPTSS